MAILQLSRITNRKGVIENLPQLAGAEFGWALDERRLFIGNGTLEGGAPVIGNTEILTEFSDILALSSTYTYKGTEAGYIVNTGENDEDVLRSLQTKFDDFASIKDFGAEGDGVTDDTDAINRALYELFCRQPNAEIRRSLFFPAGIYIVKGTIKIPPYAKVYGEGLNSSIIKYVSPGVVDDYVIATSNADHQIGLDINSGATLPTGIEMSSMGVHTTEDNSIMLLDRITDSAFSFMELKGTLTTSTIVDVGNNTAAIDVVGLSSDVTMNKMVTSGTTYGARALDPLSRNIVIENSKINTHYIGAMIDITGVVVSRTVFDNTLHEGILFASNAQSTSAYNVFYNVGNGFGAAPIIANITMASDKCLSIGDQFERSDADDALFRRIDFVGSGGIATDGSHSLRLGSFERIVGVTATLANNVTDELIFSFDSAVANSFKIDYHITRDLDTRMGTMYVSNNSSTIDYNEEYTEAAPLGVTLTMEASGATSLFKFTTTDTVDGTLNYSVVRMD